MGRGVPVRVQVRDELDEVVRRHSTTERIDKVATVSGAKVFQAFEFIARCIKWLMRNANRKAERII